MAFRSIAISAAGLVDQDFNEQSRAVLEGTTDCVFLLDRQWRFTFLNQRAVAEIAEGRNLLGATIWEAFPQAKDSEFGRRYQTAIEGGSAEFFEAYYPPLSAWYEVHAVPVENGLGVFFRNINERYTAAEALREREHQLETVFQQAVVGIMHSDLNDRMLMITDRFCEILGRSREELDGLPMQEFTHPEDVPWNMPLFQEGLRTGTSFHVEKRYVRPDGSIAWCATNVSFVRGPMGEVVSVIVVADDITDKKRAHEKAQEAQSLLQDVIDSIEDLVFVKDLEGRFVFVNKHIAGGIPLLGKRVEDLYPPELTEGYAQADREVLTTGAPSRVEETIPIDGEPRQFQTVKVPWLKEGQVKGLIGISRDLTERIQYEEELRKERRKLSTLLNNLPGLAYAAETESPWRVTFISQGAEALTGYEPASFAKGEVTWADIVHPEDLELLEEAVSQARETKDHFSSVYRIITRTGDIRWVLDRGQFIYDEGGRPISLEGFAGDLTEQKQAEERIRWVAHHDALTQLPNRLLFNERLDEAIRQAALSRHAVGLLFIDVDFLKQVNDTLGHAAGDALLTEVALRLQKSVRSIDTVARNGGDEFAVILRSLDDEAEMNTLIESILNRMREPFSYGKRPIDCQISIGASIWPFHSTKISTLVKQVDLALQAAKNTGRGRAAIYHPEMQAEAQQRATMLTRARRAVEGKLIAPFYQPKVRLSSGKLAGFEALLRWRNPKGEMDAPSTVQAAFDDARYAIAMGEQMQDCVLVDMRQWLDAGLEFGHVAINASAAEFRSGGYADALLERLRASDIPTHCLEVEVTEMVFLGRGAEYVDQALRTLHAEGVTIALDDFGTGFASLLHLKQYPVNVIKIDRSFVQDLERSPQDAAILASVLSLSQSLGLGTVAEGVETAAQAQFLQAHGCDLGQGYVFGRPAPGSSIPDLISSWNPDREQRVASTRQR